MCVRVCADNMPNTVWIWDTRTLSLACVLTQLDAVRALRWHPATNQLAVCTGNAKLYLWTDDGCSVVDVPLPGLAVQNLRWSGSDGGALVLIDREQCCLCYLDSFDQHDGDVVAPPSEPLALDFHVAAAPHMTAAAPAAPGHPTANQDWSHLHWQPASTNSRATNQRA